MCWVAIDRGIRLAEKRSLPAPKRMHWIEVRDKIYEEIQEKGYNKEKGFFSQVRLTGRAFLAGGRRGELTTLIRYRATIVPTSWTVVFCELPLLLRFELWGTAHL